MPKAKELRERETQHLTAELAEKQKHMFDLRSQAVTEKLEDPSQLKKTRKEIARIHTIIKERKLAAATKYTGGIVLLPLLAAGAVQFLEPGGRRPALIGLALAGALAIAAFFVANPGGTESTTSIDRIINPAPTRSSCAKHSSVTTSAPRARSRTFAADSRLVGKQITLNGGKRTVVGIMPAQFDFPISTTRYDLWIPIDWNAIVQCGKTSTNYQILPGDRIYMKAQPLITFTTVLERVIAPAERAFGVTLLGQETIRSFERPRTGTNGSNLVGF